MFWFLGFLFELTESLQEENSKSIFRVKVFVIIDYKNM